MFCYHTHVFGDRIISHSHPFNNPDCQHTVAEIEAITVIATTALTDLIADVPELVSPDTYIIIESGAVITGPDDSNAHTAEGRAPPFA